jgi:hypothetical protein
MHSKLDKEKHKVLNRIKECYSRSPYFTFISLVAGTDVIDSEHIFAEIFCKKIGVFTQNTAGLLKTLIAALVFKENATFTAENREKSLKTVIITSTPRSEREVKKICLSKNRLKKSNRWIIVFCTGLHQVVRSSFVTGACQCQASLKDGFKVSSRPG